MAQYRNQPAKDWNNDNFSEYPKLSRYSVSPQLYFYLGRCVKINAGFNTTGETRLGGAMPAIAGKPDSIYNYLEKNTSSRYGSNFRFEYDMETKVHHCFED